MSSKALRSSQSNTFRVEPGPTLLQTIEASLDEAFDWLKSPDGEAASEREHAETVGFAKGLTRAIAILRDPYDVESGEVRARVAAIARHKERTQ